MKKVMIAVAAMAASTGAIAGPAWTYVDAGFVQGDQVGNFDNNAYSLTGSFGFMEMWHVSGNYTGYSYGNSNSSEDFDQDADSYRIAAGMHPAMTDSTDLVVEIGYNQVSFDDNLGSSGPEPDAIDLKFGVRSMVSDSFELNGFIDTAWGSLDCNNCNDDDFTATTLSVGGQYFFTDNISVNISLANGGLFGGSSDLGSGNSAQFGARWSF